MSTLGFGDITFTSDIGRAFSILVLLSGIVLLLIVLPFAFIRFFYAPWLDARLRLRAPREAPDDAVGHVVICAWDSIAPGLIDRLKQAGIPYFLMDPDPTSAAQQAQEGLSVVTGEAESRSTYEALRVDRARLVFANAADTTNTNITLTVREVSRDVPIAAIATSEDSVDILELSGATHVLPLKQRLGEQLANRVDAGDPQPHEIGRVRGLLVVEFPVRHTPFAGQTVRESRLREQAGASIIGVWEHGRLQPAGPDTPLTEKSVAVAIGTSASVEALNALLLPYEWSDEPVLVIGGGTVGTAAVAALKRKNIRVHLVERESAPCERLRALADGVFVGDAADREVLMRAGLAAAPSVLLTTNDDAMNIYLAVYCRRLKPDLRIVSRVTYERNLESIHRAGADFVLGYATLGVETVVSLVQGRELVMLGEGVDLFTIPVPASLAGQTLADAGIGARTGLTAIGIQQGREFISSPHASTVLGAGGELLLLGSPDQRRRFAALYE